MLSFTMHRIARPNELGAKRTVLLTGIPVSAEQMWNAVKPRAAARCASSPIPPMQAIMDRDAAGHVFKACASSSGLRPSANIEEIVREYEEAAVAHHG